MDECLNYDENNPQCMRCDGSDKDCHDYESEEIRSKNCEGLLKILKK